MNAPAPTPAVLLDAKGVARWLVWSPRKISEMTASGELASIKLGRLRRYRPEAVQAYLANLERSGNSGE